MEAADRIVEVGDKVGVAGRAVERPAVSERGAVGKRRERKREDGGGKRGRW